LASNPTVSCHGNQKTNWGAYCPLSFGAISSGDVAFDACSSGHTGFATFSSGDAGGVALSFGFADAVDSLARPHSSVPTSSATREVETHFAQSREASLTDASPVTRVDEADVVPNEDECSY
jgi:ApbE superfamily uncharacterized protein (UPF0280 family)